MEITAHPRFRLPYSQDRLIPIWVATLTLKQKSRVTHSDSAAQILDSFRLPRDGLTLAASFKGSNDLLPSGILFDSETSRTVRP